MKSFLEKKIDNLKKKFFSFLRHRKPIAGLAIADDSLNVIIFDEYRNRRLGEKINIDISSGESVKNGLKNLKKKFGASFSSVVVSLPPDYSYLTMFEFPLSAEEEQIKEAMSLASSSLPLPEERIYSDWMFLENRSARKKEAVLEMAKKELIDSYLKIFEENKLSVIAAETFIWSLGRFLKEGDDITMLIIRQPKNILFALYDGCVPYFQFNLPKEKFSNEEEFLTASAHYLKSVSHFTETDNSRIRKVGNIIAIAGDKLIDYWQKELSAPALQKGEKKDIRQRKIQQGLDLGEGMRSNDLAFLAALGAMKRGLIPRKNDKIVSLLPLNTETAYEQYRLFSFADFLQKFSVGFAGFFLLVFLGNVIMVRMLFPGIEESLKKEGSFSTDVAEIMEKKETFNARIAQFSKINQATPQWENVFAAIDQVVTKSAAAGGGLTLNQINVSSDGSVSFSGVSSNRESLIKLKENLGNSEVFLSDPLPLSIFLSKGNIPFTIKAKLKDLKTIIAGL